MLQLLTRKVLNQGGLWLNKFNLRPYLRSLNEQSLVLDCGANTGLITQMFANKGAQVYAFEPDPFAFSELKSRFENHSNIHCLPKGVWCKNDRLSLYRHKELAQNNQMAFSVSSSLKNNKQNLIGGESISVEVIDLAQFIRELKQPVDLIKMDIEGAEIDVIHHLIDTGMHKQVKRLLVETHEGKIPGQKEEIKALKAKMKKLGIDHIHLNWQ